MIYKVKLKDFLKIADIALTRQQACCNIVITKKSYHRTHPGILQLNKPIMRYRPNKACFFNVKFFVLYYSILWYFL